ncbi:MAG: RNA degradosome polyphosphate kinase, partial [Actinomycetota bacterium]|nr:RNA degradosome polyphosphate kinase [Actinomycetota bacterium]
RFLEHSRIYWYANGGEPEMWIGSADLMHRNLDRRVEALVRVLATEHREQLTELLELGFSDAISSWHQQSDGTWQRVRRGPDGEPLMDIQAELIRRKHESRRTPLV